jgi:hypothetical protein
VGLRDLVGGVMVRSWHLHIWLTSRSRGHSDARIAKILGGNFARVMREVWG